MREDTPTRAVLRRAFRAACEEYGWTKQDQQALGLARCLGADFIAELPESFEAMDLPLAGQLRYVRLSSGGVWHIIQWQDDRLEHRFLCHSMCWTSGLSQGQSQRPRGEPICRRCASQVVSAEPEAAARPRSAAIPASAPGLAA
jgi:hypothetical protein